MLSNLSMDDNGMQMILMVVVVALVLYLLVSYIKDHKHKQTDILNNTPLNNVVEPDPFDNYEGFGGHEDHGKVEGFGAHKNHEEFGAHKNHEEFGAHKNHEGFEDHEEVSSNNAVNAGNGNNSTEDVSDIKGSLGVGRNDSFAPISESDNVVDSIPSECYPKDVLASQDLLPADANSKWAQSNPSGQGSLNDKNFLTAGYHVGVNTVGQSLRNANRQLRSDPPNPQVKVSPWMQTTIEPDVNRKAMEIGGN